MHRFFCKHNNLSAAQIDIKDKDEIHHLAHVLRLKPGQEVIVFNGQGKEAIAEIKSIAPQLISLTLKECSTNIKPKTTITLACAIPKKSKFEFIIEKCTELGIERIIPMVTQRTEVRISGEKQGRKLERYEKIALNAAKQCRQNFIPIIDPITPFTQILTQLSNSDLKLLPCLLGERKHLINIWPLNPAPESIVIFIGPEGDFTPKEVKEAIVHGAQPISLGQFTLKVDTAAISSCAVAKMMLEKQQ